MGETWSDPSAPNHRKVQALLWELLESPGSANLPLLMRMHILKVFLMYRLVFFSYNIESVSC